MNLTLAPENGSMYAIYKDRVEYNRYSLAELQSNSCIGNNLLELHLFDNNREYRLVQSSRGKIESCISDENVYHDDKYVERVYTQGKFDISDQVEVINYITYDENDIAMINNYRLREVK